jgi:hypothetical protein
MSNEFRVLFALYPEVTQLDFTGPSVLLRQTTAGRQPQAPR